MAQVAAKAGVGAGGEITADEIKTRKVELVLQQLDSLPTLPGIALRLVTMTGNIDTRIQEVVALLSADQSLTSKLLSLAGASGTGVRETITSVQQAVVMLGFETLRNLVLSVKVFEVFQDSAEVGNGDSAFNRAEFWKHSLAVATAAEMLAARCKPKLNVHDAFVCGLLHDIGKVAFDTAMPKSFSRVIEAAMLTRGDVADVERRIIGLDHALAGKRLAEAWNLPQMIMQAIWLHGTSPMAMTQGISNPQMVLVVGLADMLARRQHIGFSGNYLFPYETSQYAQALGLGIGDIDAVTRGLTEALELRARAIGLYDVESKQLYLQSIANANAELGRVNQTLAMQNRKLAMRSTCFEMMTKFYQRIVPAASPAQLLVEVGNVGHTFFDSPKMALFSQDPDQKVGEVLLFDATSAGGTGGKAGGHESFLMNMPAHGGDQRLGREGRANQSFTRQASPQLDWLMERVQPFLGTTQCWFMPLLCGAEPVGGVVWVAKDTGNSMQGLGDLALVAQSWGMTLRTSQVREQQNILTESLAAANRELGSLQQQMVRNKAILSLGEMAAGAAHEMNNPLAVICGRAQLLSAKLADAQLKQEASLIAQQGDRLSQIITDMMEFAKPHQPRVGTIDVLRLVDEAVAEAAERVAGPNGKVLVRVEKAEHLPEVQGDTKQIRGAIAEVVANGIQAAKLAEASKMKGGKGAAGEGEVVVALRFDALDNQLIVQVTDAGVGMSEETMRNAFSPFFSMKTAGRQRGMGLAKALRWMENHGGTIRLDSTLGSGTTVVMLLPAG